MSGINETTVIHDHEGYAYYVVKSNDWRDYSAYKRIFVARHGWCDSKDYDAFIRKLTDAMEI